MNNETITIPLSKDEARLIEIIRRYTASYCDFKVEMRDGKIKRVLPTFSELVNEITTKTGEIKIPM